MVDRRQIVGGLVDGPLTFENAVSPEAVRQAKLTSPVAGQADILVAPDLEAGTMLVQQLDRLANAQSAALWLAGVYRWRCPNPAATRRASWLHAQWQCWSHALPEHTIPGMRDSRFPSLFGHPCAQRCMHEPGNHRQQQKDDQQRI